MCELTFCTQEPSAMAGFMESTEEWTKKTKQARSLLKNPVNLNEGFFSIYFDGDLESLMGFDVVYHVDGVLPKIKIGDKIPCLAIAPDGKEHEGIVHVFPHEFEAYLYCLIRLK